MVAIGVYNIFLTDGISILVECQSDDMNFNVTYNNIY